MQNGKWHFSFSVLQLNLGFVAGQITYSDATKAGCLSVGFSMTRNDATVPTSENTSTLQCAFNGTHTHFQYT